ncbi:MAG: LptA/OstA family protein [bacterium]
MEESFAWKIVYVATIFSLLVLGLAYYLISPRDSTYYSDEKTNKVAEFTSARTSGRKDGKRVWEFKAKTGWTEKNQEITHLQGVSEGYIYNKEGRLIVNDLSANGTDVYRRTDIVEAFGQVKADIDLSKFSSQKKAKVDWTKVTADRMKYSNRNKTSEISGHITLIKRNNIIIAEQINVDHDRKIALIPSQATVKRKDGIIKADSLEYFGETEQSNANGNIILDLKEKKIKTQVKCNEASFNNDPEKDVTLNGNLEVVQGKKVSVADSGVYSKNRKSLRLLGRTKTIIEKVGAVIKKESVEKLKSPEQKELLHEKTVVTANKMFFSTKTGDAKAFGNVIVTQKGREAKADSATYDDKNEFLTLTGNVFMKKKDQWISCKQVIVSINKETFEALGVKEAKFKL